MARRKHNTMLTALISEQCNYRKRVFYYFLSMFFPQRSCMIYVMRKHVISQVRMRMVQTWGSEIPMAVFAPLAPLLSAAFQGRKGVLLNEQHFRSKMFSSQRCWAVHRALSKQIFISTQFIPFVTFNTIWNCHGVYSSTL